MISGRNDSQEPNDDEEKINIEKYLHTLIIPKPACFSNALKKASLVHPEMLQDAF